jgi:hypothetical protein
MSATTVHEDLLTTLGVDGVMSNGDPRPETDAFWARRITDPRAGR